MKKFSIILLVFMAISANVFSQSKQLIISSSEKNTDIVELLTKNGYKFTQFSDPLEAVKKADSKSGVLILSDNYPFVANTIDKQVYKIAEQKKLRLYLEFADNIPGITYGDGTVKIHYERGIVTSNVFGNELSEMSILGINGVVQKIEAKKPLIVLGKVAGVYKAEYGIDDVETYPVLFEHNNTMVASTKLSGYSTGRYGPKDSWETVWSYVLNWLDPDTEFRLDKALENVVPMYSKTEKLPSSVIKDAVITGADWFYNGSFLIDKSWEQYCKNMQMPGAGYGPYLDETVKKGDGSLGIIEGHGSILYWNGTQQYRYCNRADDNGQVAFALAITNEISGRSKDAIVASNLMDFLFYNSQILDRGGKDPSNPSFGLMGWSDSKHSNWVYYGDDNARAIFGALGASASLDIWNWDKEILETILANFRTTGTTGFRGHNLTNQDLQKNGWEHYWNGNIISPHPHFESWMWACYLWLYDKTGYKPLLKKSRNAIKVTMEAYPDKWGWTNGIQQERARMILPLAWLVRVDDTPKHREWLNVIVEQLLKNQKPCGAIIEELGDAKSGMFGNMGSNKDYGTNEAPLIFKNGDPIADMLYTSNFAIFSLNEAAKVTNKPEHIEGVNNLAEFLTRIQIKSDKYHDLNGGWFRAFDFGKWDYWASNADHGWGAWGTHSGWTQATIVSTLALIVKGESFWEHTAKSKINDEMKECLDNMLGDKK